MLVTVNWPFPLFVSVIAWGELVLPTDWEGKFRLVGLKLAAEAMPVPVNATVCGFPCALSLIVRVPVRVPAAVGRKVTLIAHDWLAGIEEHWVVAEKSPDVMSPETAMAFAPVFATVTICAELVDPTAWLLKTRLAGVIVAVET